MTDIRIVPRTCPICGLDYEGHSAVSRKDNKTLICPVCGIREALESIGIMDQGEQDHIITLALQKGGSHEKNNA